MGKMGKVEKLEKMKTKNGKHTNRFFHETQRNFILFQSQLELRNLVGISGNNFREFFFIKNIFGFIAFSFFLGKSETDGFSENVHGLTGGRPRLKS